MRDYGKVYSTFWSSSTIVPLSDDGRMLALYLLTCAHSTIAGVFRMPDGYVSEDLPGWSVERVRKGFAELFANGFANRCETTKWVWIVKHLKWNPPDNPNQRKAAAKVAASIPPECAWKQAFMRVCGPELGLEAPAGANPSETVGQPFRNQEQKQEQKAEDRKQEQNTEEKARSPNARRTRPEVKVPDCPEGVAGQVWNDWLLLRKAKRAPVTETVLSDAINEAAKAGITLEAFLTIWCRRGSQGLDAGWLKPNELGAARVQPDLAELTAGVQRRLRLGSSPASFADTDYTEGITDGRAV